MTDKNFFEKQTLSSRVKASIVSEYFPKYCKIIIKKHMPERIGYYDLFAGPGMYEDGNAKHWHIVFLKDKEGQINWLLSKPEIREVEVTEKLL